MRTIKHNWRFFQRFLRFKQFFKAVNHWAHFHFSSNIQISMCSKISNLTKNCPLIVKISKLHEISEFQNLANPVQFFFAKSSFFIWRDSIRSFLIWFQCTQVQSLKYFWSIGGSFLVWILEFLAIDCITKCELQWIWC